jgi:hypothetical protein
MPLAIELFTNPPTTAVTVTAGGTTAPTAGTTETWTLAGGYAQLPQVSNAAVPPTQFHFYDASFPSEIMLGTNLSGATLSVTRGVEGATVAHPLATNLPVQTISAGVMGLFQQQSPSKIPASQGDATTTTVTTVSTTTFYPLSKAWAIPANDANVATIYELTVFGNGTWASTACSLNFQVSAFGVVVAKIQVGSTMLPASANFCWGLTTKIVVINNTSSGSIAAESDGAISNYAQNLSVTGGSSANSTAGLAGQSATTSANVAAGGTLQLTAQWNTAAGSVSSFGSLLDRKGQ